MLECGLCLTRGPEGRYPAGRGSATKLATKISLHTCSLPGSLPPVLQLHVPSLLSFCLCLCWQSPFSGRNSLLCYRSFTTTKISVLSVKTNLLSRTPSLMACVTMRKKIPAAVRKGEGFLLTRGFRGFSSCSVSFAPLGDEVAYHGQQQVAKKNCSSQSGQETKER